MTKSPAKTEEEKADERSEYMEMGPLKKTAPISKLSIKAKGLPPNFAEHVLDIEMEIERGNFNIETINSLLFLYSVCHYQHSSLYNLIF